MGFEYDWDLGESHNFTKPSHTNLCRYNKTDVATPCGDSGEDLAGDALKLNEYMKANTINKSSLPTGVLHYNPTKFILINCDLFIVHLETVI